jgi:hypothetical protein
MGDADDLVSQTEAVEDFGGAGKQRADTHDLEN